jgi:hypothetical protein
MSWLSDAWHGVESFVTANESWLLPVAIGAGALAGGALLGPALFGAGGLFGAGAEATADVAGSSALFGGGAFEAGGEGAALSAEEAAAEAGAAGGAELAPGAVDITVTPFSGAALEEGAGAGIEGGIGGSATNVAALEAGGVGDASTSVLADAGPLDTLLTGGVVGPSGGGDLAGIQLAEADTGTMSDAPLFSGTQNNVSQLTQLAEADQEPSETVAARFPLPDSGDAMPTGGTFSQAQAAGAANPTAYAGTPSAAPGLPSEITTGSSVAGDVGPTTGSVGASSVQTPASIGAGIDQSFAGVGKGLEGALSSPWVKYGLPLAAIGGLALQGPGKLPPQTAGAMSIANQEATAGATQLNEALAGQITPAQQSQIDQWAQGQKNQLYQLYASRGVDPSTSTDFVQASAAIDAQALAQRSAIIQQMITNALNFDTAASNTLTNVASQQVQLDTNFRSSISSALGSFGLMAALGSRGGGGSPTTTPAQG